MEVRLLVAHPSAETKQIRLGAETLIGRSPDCKLRISSGQVSRRHCVIKVTDASVSVRDLGSANGTRLNGQTIATDTDVPILPGSTLVVGPLKFIVQFAVPRSTADEDTELLSDLAAVAKSSAPANQAKSAGRVADGEETKDYPPTQKRRRSAPPQVVVARNDATAESDAGESDPDESDAGRTTEQDIAIDPGETIFDVSLDDPADVLNRGAGKPGKQTDSEKAAETHLLFEEDDLPPDNVDK